LSYKFYLKMLQNSQNLKTAQFKMAAETFLSFMSDKILQNIRNQKYALKN
jgi:hypothetical protein